MYKNIIYGIFSVQNTLTLLFIGMLSVSCSSIPGIKSSELVRISVTSEALNPVDRLIFGQMLHKSSTGEPGPELIVDMKTGRLPDDVVAMIKDMNIPVIKFPGDVDKGYTDWRNTINHVPGKHRFRPLTCQAGNGSELRTRFGIDEFARFKKELKCEGIIVVNLLDGLARKGPVREAAERAAGLVAYCNATSRSKLPESIRHWPGIRTKNGNPQPFNIEYVQLGSSLSSTHFISEVKKALPDFDSHKLAQWYIDCITVYIQFIRLADPDIKIIIDANMGGGLENTVLENPYIKRNIDILAVSYYRQTKGFSRQPADNGALNKSLDRVHDLSTARNLSKPFAVSEWNFISPNSETSNISRQEIEIASALNSACWFNEMMRAGQHVKIGIQSRLLGGYSNNACIRIDSEHGPSPFLTPRGKVASLYAHFHGNTRIKLNLNNAPSIFPNDTEDDSAASLLDLVATASESKLFLHAVNRSRSKSTIIKAGFEAHPLTGSYKVITLFASPAPAGDGRVPELRFTEKISEGQTANNKIRLVLPPASVSVIALPLR